MMKKLAIVLLMLLALLPTAAAFAAKRTTDVPEQTTVLEEIVMADIYPDAQADTLGGSDGGAPEADMDAVFAYEPEAWDTTL